MNRETLINLERMMRGKPGVGIVRGILRDQVHAALARAPLVLRQEWLAKDEATNGDGI